MPTRFAAVQLVLALPLLYQLLAQPLPAPPRVPEGCISLIAGRLLAARSSATVSRAQRGQSVSERLAEVCCLSPSPRHDRRVSRAAAGVLPAGRTAPPGGGWEASGGAGTAGGGEALAGVPREKWLYIPYTHIFLHYSRK